jgi:hypothetical protein
VAEGLDEAEGERVYVTMYGLTLLGIRVLLFALDEYARREHLYSRGETEEEEEGVRKSLLPVVVAYGIAILIGLVLPRVAVGLYCVPAIFLVVPFRELRRLLFNR